jgi:hypothetical protein
MLTEPALPGVERRRTNQQSTMIDMDPTVTRLAAASRGRMVVKPDGGKADEVPRGERPLDPEDTPLVKLAGDLRMLRRRAGNPTYRELAGRTHYSVSTLSGAAGGRKLPTLEVVLAYATACAGDRAEWERRWRAVARELAPEPPAGPSAYGAAAAGAAAPPPYVGLAAFQVGDAERFFGREALIAEVIAVLGRRSMVAVFGASGAGKSSLLRAGVLPRLRAMARESRAEGRESRAEGGEVRAEGGEVRVAGGEVRAEGREMSAEGGKVVRAGRWQGTVLFTPGADPLEECAIALARLAGRLPGVVRAELAAGRRGLRRVVRDILDRGPEGAGLVLVVDQFEELFTLTTDAGEREVFIDALCDAAADPRQDFRVVLGVRADFFAHCTGFPRLAEVLRDGSVIVGPMTVDELRRAVTQPAAGLGYAVETPLLTELVAQATGQTGVLPLLSHALLETWRRRRGDTLTLEGFRAAGGIEGALSKTAESVWSGLPPAARTAAKHLMLRLTAVGDGTQDTRRRVARSELDDSRDVGLVLERFAGARLIAVDRDAIEISHEALIRSWPRLREWLAEDRDGRRVHRELTAATEAWHAVHQDRGALYRGVRLARAAEWAARDGAALSGREREFLTASTSAERAERVAARRGRSRLRRAVALLSVLLVVVVAVTVYAITIERSAAAQRNSASSRVVATRAALLRPVEPVLAAQLGLAAYRLAPTGEAREGLLTAVPFPSGRRLAGHTGNVNSVRCGAVRCGAVRCGAVRCGPDGRSVATAGEDKTARLRDVSRPGAHRQLALLQGHAEVVSPIAVSPDGRSLVTGGDRCSARRGARAKSEGRTSLDDLVGVGWDGVHQLA